VNGRDADVRMATTSRRTPLVSVPDISRFVLPEEQVRYRDRRHPIVLVGPLAVVIAVCVIAGVIVATVGAGPVLDFYFVVIVAAVGWFLYRLIRWSRVVLVVTDRRVFEVESMVINRATIRPVFRQSVEFFQDPLGELLNYGTVSTAMPGGDRVNHFKWVHNPADFYKAVTDRAV
jgi:hypothetical protein